MNIQIYVEHIFSIQIRKCSFIFHRVSDLQTKTEKRGGILQLVSLKRTTLTNVTVASQNMPANEVVLLNTSVTGALLPWKLVKLWQKFHLTWHIEQEDIEVKQVWLTRHQRYCSDCRFNYWRNYIINVHQRPVTKRSTLKDVQHLFFHLKSIYRAKREGTHWSNRQRLFSSGWTWQQMHLYHQIMYN